CSFSSTSSALVGVLAADSVQAPKEAKISRLRKFMILLSPFKCILDGERFSWHAQGSTSCPEAPAAGSTRLDKLYQLIPREDGRPDGRTVVDIESDRIPRAGAGLVLPARPN